MSITAKLHYLRIAPRKVRITVDLIRGKTIDEAQAVLNFTVKRTAQPLLKLLKQAIANAKNKQIEPSNLYISKITVDEGPKLKRWRARARGRAFEIQKKTSHITLILDAAIEKKLKKTKKLVKVKKIKEGEETNVSSSPIEKTTKIKMPKLRAEREVFRPKVEKKGFKKFFRRKAF